MLPVTPEPTRFADLNDLLTGWHEVVATVLADDLVGAYLVGGFALGAGDLASDCDFLVVTRGQLSTSQEAALRVLHDEIPTRPGHWPHDLEGSYAPVDDLRSLDGLGRAWLYVDRGGREMEWSTHCNALDVRWVLRERAIVLSGPAPSTFAAEVPADLLRAHAREHLDSFLQDLATWATFEHGWAQRYVVQTACRLLLTLETGAVTSKHAGLEWALTTVPARWHPLIEQVIADRELIWNEPPRPGSVRAAEAFVAYAQEHAATIPT